MKFTRDSFLSLVKEIIKEERFSQIPHKKNQWVSFDSSDLNSNKSSDIDITDEILALLKTAYSNAGGHHDFQSKSDIPGKQDSWELIDLDQDPEPDAVRVGKNRSGGEKLTAIGHDGQRASKDAVLQRIVTMLNTTGYYAEVSGTMANFLLKDKKVPIIGDEEMVRKLLKGKDIRWLGTNPSGSFSDVEGWYIRNIGGDEKTKLLIGKPRSV